MWTVNQASCSILTLLSLFLLTSSVTAFAPSHSSVPVVNSVARSARCSHPASPLALRRAALTRDSPFSRLAGDNPGESENTEDTVEIPIEELEQLAQDAGVKIQFAQPQVNKLMENPLISTMTNELMKDEAGLDAIQDKLKSGQGIGQIMGSPEFQNLAKSMMQNPEIMGMLNNPTEMSKAYGEVMGQMKNMPAPKPDGEDTEA